jgi:hypothetical protein
LIRRIFHVLFGVCTAWALFLALNWGQSTHLLGVPVVLGLAICPWLIVFAVYYVVGQYRDLF